MTYMRAWTSLNLGQIRLLVSMATDRVIMEKRMLPLFLGCFYPILFILAGNDDMHESSKEFEIWPDPTTDCGVSCPLASEKIPHRRIMGKNGVAFLDQILFILAGNDDIHKSLDEVEIWPDPTGNHRVSCS